MSVDIAEVAGESFAHFRVALDLLDDALLVECEDVVLEDQLVGEALILYPRIVPVKFNDFALGGGFARHVFELLVIGIRHQIVVASPTFLLCGPPVQQHLLLGELPLPALMRVVVVDAHLSRQL